MGSLVAELAEKLSSATNSIDFDEQTLFLNTSANTVGVGTNAPASKFDVRGTMQVGIDGTGHDVKFFGTSSGKYWLWDESDDSVRISGHQYHTGQIFVGVDGTGHDVKFFGDTASAYMLWDESADDLVLGGVAGINVSGTGTITGTLATAAQGNITSLGTLTTLTVDSIIINGTNIGHTSDTNAIAISSGGVVTMDQIPVFSAGINVSGGTIAGTLATAAQGTVTSLGTLTGLTVSGTITGTAANALVLSTVTNDASTPTLAFGDGDTGFYEASDDSLQISIGGTAEYQIDDYDIRSKTTGAFMLDKLASSATNPTYAWNGDTNSGLGRSAADTIHLTTTGLSRMKIDASGHTQLCDGNFSGNMVFDGCKLHLGSTPTADKNNDALFNIASAYAETRETAYLVDNIAWSGSTGGSVSMFTVSSTTWASFNVSIAWSQIQIGVAGYRGQETYHIDNNSTTYTISSKHQTGNNNLIETNVGATWTFALSESGNSRTTAAVVIYGAAASGGNAVSGFLYNRLI